MAARKKRKKRTARQGYEEFMRNYLGLDEREPTAAERRERNKIIRLEKKYKHKYIPSWFKFPAKAPSSRKKRG